MNGLAQVWITKYALTKGIYKEAVEIDGNMASTCVGWRTHYHGEGREWHRSEQSAVKRAEELRMAKIESLEAQLRKLNALVIKVVKS